MKNKKTLIFLIIIAIVIAGGSIYFFCFANRRTISKKDVSNSSTISKKEKVKVDVPVIINVGNSSNAKIYIDGKLVGEGKAEVKIQEGVHSLKVVDEKKGEYIEPFFLSKETGIYRKTVNVQPKGRAVTFKTGLNNCTLYIDGTNVMTFNESLELMLPLGKYTVEITSPGYDNFKKELNITESSETSLSISLKKKNQ